MDFYTWLDQLAKKKANDWSIPPQLPLSDDEVYLQMLNDPTYNYRTFFNLQPFQALNMLNADSKAHFTDIAKTMYHPTVSNESVFSGYPNEYNPLGIEGGSWNEEGTEYTPSKSQLENYFNYNTTRKYLDVNEDRPVKINIPKYTNGLDQMGNFINNIGPLIYRALKARNISNINQAYNYMMRQLALESTYGNQRYSNIHNYGGIMSNGKLKQFKDDQQFADYYTNLINSRYNSALNAKDLYNYANELYKRGYYKDTTVDAYYGKLNGMKTFNRMLQDHFNKNKNLYNQTTGVINNAQTGQASFVQPVVTQQQPIQSPYKATQNIKTLRFPIFDINNAINTNLRFTPQPMQYKLFEQ